jgi:hypothetical protein
VRLKSIYSLSRYKNIVNNSGLKDNNIKTLNTELFFKTAYDKPLNFENIIMLKSLQSNSAMASYFNKSFKEMFKLIYRPTKNILAWVATDFIIPNMSAAKINYLFIDAVVKLSPKDKKTDLMLRAKNILNRETFRAYDITDYSTTTLSTTILPRYLIISISRSF